MDPHADVTSHLSSLPAPLYGSLPGDSARLERGGCCGPPASAQGPRAGRPLTTDLRCERWDERDRSGSTRACQYVVLLGLLAYFLPAFSIASSALSLVTDPTYVFFLGWATPCLLILLVVALLLQYLIAANYFLRPEKAARVSRQVVTLGMVLFCAALGTGLLLVSAEGSAGAAQAAAAVTSGCEGGTASGELQPLLEASEARVGWNQGTVCNPIEKSTGEDCSAFISDKYGKYLLYLRHHLRCGLVCPAAEASSRVNTTARAGPSKAAGQNVVRPGDIVRLTSDERRAVEAFGASPGLTWRPALRAFLGHSHRVVFSSDVDKKGIAGVVGLRSGSADPNEVEYFPGTLLEKAHLPSFSSRSTIPSRRLSMHEVCFPLMAAKLDAAANVLGRGLWLQGLFFIVTAVVSLLAASLFGAVPFRC